MKTRLGFVSNSSSSSYIVGIPNDYVPDVTTINKIVTDELDKSIEFGNDTVDFDTLEKWLRDAIDGLKKGNQYFEDAYPLGSQFNMIVRLCEKEDFVIDVPYTEETTGMIYNIFQKGIRQNLIKQLKRAEELENPVYAVTNERINK